MNWDQVIKDARARGSFTPEEMQAALGCFDCRCDNQNHTKIFRQSADGPQDTWLYCWSIDFYLAVRHNKMEEAAQILIKFDERRMFVSLPDDEVLPLDE